MSELSNLSPQQSIPGELQNVEQDLYAMQIPENLRRATSRLQFSPTYVVVGVYRLFTDKNLYIPAWRKCQHGLMRGASISLIWVSLVKHRHSHRHILSIMALIDCILEHRESWHSRYKENLWRSSSSGSVDLYFWQNFSDNRTRSPRITGLSRDAIFGIPMPFDLPTCTLISSIFHWCACT